MVAKLAEELAFACEIARKAGSILLDVYGTDFSYELKSPVDPVTEADRRANEFLANALRARFPSDGIVAEETADTSDSLDKQRCWYVDPLDGTKEFIARNGEFSVMLGLAIDRAAELGVVYRPVEDKLYAGVVAHGAFIEQRGTRRPLVVSDHSSPDDLCFVSSRSHRSSKVDLLVTRLGLKRQMVSGSVGLKVGLIAEQAADIYVHFSKKTAAWDACGPDALLRAANGRFTDLTGKQIQYGGSDLYNRRGILACNASAFDQVRAVVDQMIQESRLTDLL